MRQGDRQDIKSQTGRRDREKVNRPRESSKGKGRFDSRMEEEGEDGEEEEEEELEEGG